MLPKSLSIPMLLLSFLFAAMVGALAMDSRKIMIQKANDQLAATNAFNKWAQDYATLLPIDAKWKAEIKSANEAKHILSVYEMIGDGLGINADQLVVAKTELLKENEILLDGYLVCLSTTQSQNQGLQMEAPTFTQLLTNIHTLLKRPDIRVGTLQLSQEKGKAKAVFSNFCLILRNN